MNPVIASILASTVVAAIISSLVSFRVKNLEYRNEYYKLIINKRLESYQSVERIILLLQNTIVDKNDSLVYHEIFNEWSNLNEFKEDVRVAIYKAMWLAKPTFRIVKEIEFALMKFDDDFNWEKHDDIILGGKHYFDDLERLKLQLEKACRYDILHLHKIK